MRGGAEQQGPSSAAQKASCWLVGEAMRRGQKLITAGVTRKMRWTKRRQVLGHWRMLECFKRAEIFICILRRDGCAAKHSGGDEEDGVWTMKW